MKHPGGYQLEEVDNTLRIDHIRNLGIGLELACNGGSCGGISLKRNECHLHLKTPHISLSCKVVPVQYREYEYGLFGTADVSSVSFSKMGASNLRVLACVASVPVRRAFLRSGQAQIGARAKKNRRSRGWWGERWNARQL